MDKLLFDRFPAKNDVEQGDVLLLSLFNFALEYNNNNNNNNNNNIYLLKFGCDPLAVVILHVYKT